MFHVCSQRIGQPSREKEGIRLMSGKGNPRGTKRGILLAAAMFGASATAAVAHETTNYSYDARGRLVKAVRTGTVNGGMSVQTDYSHDAADNRTRKETKQPAD